MIRPLVIAATVALLLAGPVRAADLPDWVEYSNGDTQAMAYKPSSYAVFPLIGRATMDWMMAFKTPIPLPQGNAAFLFERIEIDCIRNLTRISGFQGIAADALPIGGLGPAQPWEAFPPKTTPIGALLAGACIATLPEGGTPFRGSDQDLARDMASRLPK